MRENFFFFFLKIYDRNTCIALYCKRWYTCSHVLSPNTHIPVQTYKPSEQTRSHTVCKPGEVSAIVELTLNSSETSISRKGSCISHK